MTGPFTVEAVPAPVVKPIADVEEAHPPADASVGRSGDGPAPRGVAGGAAADGRSRQGRPDDPVRPCRAARLGRAGSTPTQKRSRPNAARVVATKRLAYGKPERVVISFGPEHAPLEQRQVELAWEEARTLDPRPAILLFAAFQFDPEAAKDIDELTKEKTGVTFLKVQMNTDLLTEDLKKKRASNESFWLMGQPDVDAAQAPRTAGKRQVEVHGFDYYNTEDRRDRVGRHRADRPVDARHRLRRPKPLPAPGLLPDGRRGDGWARLAKNLKAEIDEELIEKYRGTVSLPLSSRRARAGGRQDRGRPRHREPRSHAAREVAGPDDEQDDRPTHHQLALRGAVRHWTYDRETRSFTLKDGAAAGGLRAAPRRARSRSTIPASSFRWSCPNAIRPRVKAWREAGYPGVTGITRRLLEHWRDPSAETAPVLLLPARGDRDADLARPKPRQPSGRASTFRATAGVSAALCCQDGHRLRQDHRHGDGRSPGRCSTRSPIRRTSASRRTSSSSRRA